MLALWPFFYLLGIGLVVPPVLLALFPYAVTLVLRSWQSVFVFAALSLMASLYLKYMGAYHFFEIPIYVHMTIVLSPVFVLSAISARSFSETLSANFAEVRIKASIFVFFYLMTAMLVVRDLMSNFIS